MADGKSNPFGNGAGGMKGPLAMPTDFTKNPGGSRNPVPTQPSYAANPDISSRDAAPGGRQLQLDPVRSPGKDLGAGTAGMPVPFKLNP